MITFVCEEHTEAICQMPDHLFTNLMASLEKGLKEYPFIGRVTCIISPSLEQAVNQPRMLTACSKLVPTTGNKQCEHNLSIACEHICNNLFADL